MKLLTPRQCLTIFGCAALVLLTACASTVNTVERAVPIGQRQMVNDKRVITDAGLNRAVRIVGVNEAPGEFIKVQIELLKSFNYRFEWFDANGVQVSSPTASYIPRQIEGKESIFISAVAPTPSAKDFRLKLIDSAR
jgi:uncharacterized protein YcfL